MADITYNVLVNLETKGNLSANIGGLNRSLGGLQSAANGVGHALGGMVDGLRGAFEGVVESVASVVAGVAKIGAVAAFGAVTYGATVLNSELEKTQIGLAAIFNANGIAGNMTEGMEASGRLMSKMRKDAAELPGEFKDLVNIFQMSASSGLHAGLSANALEQMSAQVMAASVSTGISSPVAAREFSLLLAGRATASNVLGQKVFGLVGDKAKEFRGMSNDERVKFLTEGLQKFSPAIETFKGSFEGLWTTMVDNAKKFLGMSTFPAFETLKKFIGQANTWFTDNEGRVNYWAQTIGEHLSNAMVYAKDKILEWWPSIKHFATEAFFELRDIWRKLEPVVEGFGAKLKNLMDTGKLVPMLEKIAALYALSKGFGVVQNIMPSGGSLLSIANVLGGGGGMGGLAGAGGMAGAGAIAGAGGVALVSAGLALASMFHVLTDQTSEFHVVASQYFSGIGHDLESMHGGFSLLGDAIDPVINALGTLDLGMIKLYTGIGSLVSEIAKGAAHRAREQIDGFLGNFGTSIDALQGVGQQHREVKDKSVVKKVDDIENDILKKTLLGAGGGGGGVHVDKVEINISSNQDPSRIARMTAAHLAELKRKTKISPFSTNFGVVNK